MNPPKPLKNSRSGRAGTTSEDLVADGRRGGGNSRRLESLLTLHLLSQGTAAAQEHSSGGSLEQCAILSRNEISSENKHAAERILSLVLEARLAGPHLGLQSLLEVLRVRGGPARSR